MGEMVAPALPRLFLSYGRRDAEALAARLEVDLAAAGFPVFRDRPGLRPGEAWDEALGRAIAASDVLISLLSPHAVRTAADPGNEGNRDSVCLDEIALADRLGKRIVPLLVSPCRVPMLIARLHQIDFTNWQTLPGVYHAGRAQLLAALVEPAAVAAPVDPGWDFGPLIRRLSEGFVGRAWLFAEVEAWLDGVDSAPLLLLGEPGIGKSAFLAELVRREGGRGIVAWSFFQAATPATRQAWRFVRELAALLARHVPLLAAALGAPVIARELTEDACRLDPISAFERGLVTPLASLAPPGRNFAVALDALDEAAQAPGGGVAVTTLLTDWNRRMPPWLRLLATSRPDPAALRGLAEARTLRLVAEDARNLADIASFLSGGLPGQPVAAAVAARSEGNFLYAREAMGAIAAGAAPEMLPRGLPGLYARFLERAFPSAEAYAPAARLLAVMLAAEEPLPSATLAGIAGLTPRAARAALDGLAGFLVDEATGPSLHHWTLAEWLIDGDRGDARFLVDSAEGRALIIAWCVAHPRGHYALAHLPAHLAAAGRVDDLATLLAGSFSSDKAACFDEGAVSADWGLLCRALVTAGRDREAAALVTADSRRAAAAAAALGAAKLPPDRLARILPALDGPGEGGIRARTAAFALAAEAGLGAILVSAVSDKRAAVRSAAITGLDRLRRAHPPAGWAALEKLAAMMVNPLGLPRGRVLESLGGASLALISSEATDAAALHRLAALWQASVVRLSRAPLARLFGRASLLRLMRPRLAGILARQPDYQPFNLAEMRACYARPPEFRALAEPMIALIEDPRPGPDPLLAEMRRDVPFDVHRMLAAERALVVLGATQPDATMDALEQLHREAPAWFHQSLLYAGFHLAGAAETPGSEVRRYLALANEVIGAGRGVFVTETRRYRLVPHMAWPEIVLTRHFPADAGAVLGRWYREAVLAGDRDFAARAVAAAGLISFAYGQHREALAALAPAIAAAEPALLPELAQTLANIRVAAPDLVDAVLGDTASGPGGRALVLRVRALMPSVSAADFPTWVDAFFNYLLIRNPDFRAGFVGAFRRAAAARSVDAVLDDLILLVTRLLGEWRG